MEYVKNNEIVLNVGFEATSSLKLGNDFIEFRARFGGMARDILVPVDHVVAIYARENGQGMAFPMPTGESEASHVRVQRPRHPFAGPGRPTPPAACAWRPASVTSDAVPVRLGRRRGRHRPAGNAHAGAHARRARRSSASSKVLPRRLPRPVSPT